MSHNLTSNKNKEKVIDHLFRHQYGKLVAILTRFFGLAHLEMIEDAVQDTFILAMVKWRQQIPDNPEGWLTRAAKNRAIDLLRKIKADNNRITKVDQNQTVENLEHLFLEHEIADSQLRMIFTACHPTLHPRDQIAFALKTIAGFSTKEIAAALLLKPETIKKRLSRARKTIKSNNLTFSLPDKQTVLSRLDRVLEVVYLIFNEGFHSNHQKMLIRKDLCGEAIRLMTLILKKEVLRTGNTYALFGLLCFHAARLESKVSEDFESIDLKNQDRSTWYQPLIQLGNDAMHKAMEYNDYSCYHIEAAIAIEHLKANSFAETDWWKILYLYQKLQDLTHDPLTNLNVALVRLQLNQNEEALDLLNKINPTHLEQRAYLYYGVKAEFYQNIGQSKQAVACIDQALEKVSNNMERKYLLQKKQSFIS